MSHKNCLFSREIIFKIICYSFEIKHGTVITVTLVDSDSSMDGRY